MDSCLSAEEAKNTGIAFLWQTSRLFSSGSCLATTDSKCFKGDAGTGNSATEALTNNFPPNLGQFLVDLCLKHQYLYLCVCFCAFYCTSCHCRMILTAPTRVQCPVQTLKQCFILKGKYK